MRHLRTVILVAVVLLLLGLIPVFAVAQDADAPPETVTVAGTIQSVLGCDEDWQPPCEETFLDYDATGDIWRGSFDLPAGSYEYKAALNGSWEQNYGLGAQRDGPNVPLELEADSTVTFYFDVKTGWITDDVNSVIANVPGSFHDEVGCPGEWAPDCLRTWLQDPDGDGIYVYQTPFIPGGSYEAKVAVNGTWDVNYGADGQPGGANIGFDVPEEGALVTFSFDTADNLLTISNEPVPEGMSTELPEPTMPIAAGPRPAVQNPDSVTVAGTIQSVLGCPGDWQPPCEETFLTYDEGADIWRGSFTIPAGSYEYKAALNGSWDVNYGLGAEPNGPNIPLEVTEEMTVTFLFDIKTGWITDSVNSIIANVPGSFQSEIGCASDWAPDCYRTWLQDADGDGVYMYLTDAIPAGDYEAKVALNGSWTLNYGDEGTRDGPNIPFSVGEDGDEVLFSFNSRTNVMTITSGDSAAPRGNLTRARAQWIAAGVIVWAAEDAGADAVYTLHYDPNAALSLTPAGVEGGETISLTEAGVELSPELAVNYPHLVGRTVLTLNEDDLALVPEILRGQVVVSASDADGTLLDATGIQMPGVLDDLYANEEPLGVVWDGDVPTISVWAPTAQNVVFHLFADSGAETVSEPLPMTRDDATGIWSITGEPSWKGQYYLFEVDVYVRTTLDIEKNFVTDPYSVSLSMNSTRSQIVDLSDDVLKPEGWDTLEKPALDAPEDITVYELHVRDFSIRDMSVPEELRGKFLAFTLPDTNGMRHLQALAAAGLSHLHLLPTFDIATINENPLERVEAEFDALEEFPSDSEQQQAIIDPVRDMDGFNWGYDPYHFNAPEGSYATDAEGVTRIVEYRQMVQALNNTGLRLVIDVVYNHTNAAGQGDRSVFDRIVSGYYYRMNDSGNYYTSTCCPGTATEHYMMGRFMVDSVVLWATEYKIDAFRFDLMGYHRLDNMVAVREALNALTLEEDGVDGSQIYVYGEGWNPGDVPDRERGVMATQLNLGGFGIGTFSDRLRDAARGGNPFGGLQDQGFINGLYTNPNGLTAGTEEEQLDRLLLFQDQIRIGLTGNLATYTLTNRFGEEVTGAEIPYNDVPTGYALDPQEVLNYVSKHDNETLFDIIQLKAPADTSVADRVRMQNMGLSLITMSQGVPFFHAGSDMLRSKSLDRDSYNSGDWFNHLDFTYETSNFGIGLPPAWVGSNRDNWPVMQPILAREELRPQQPEILRNVEHFREMLQVRYSSPLFRLRTAEQVQGMMAFHNTGPDQVPGVIVMSLTDDGSAGGDYGLIVVVFNSRPDAVELQVDALVGADLSLHPVLMESTDPIVAESAFDAETGTLSVPAITTAVFVVEQ